MKDYKLKLRDLRASNTLIVVHYESRKRELKLKQKSEAPKAKAPAPRTKKDEQNLFPHFYDTAIQKVPWCSIF